MFYCTKLILIQLTRTQLISTLFIRTLFAVLLCALAASHANANSVGFGIGRSAEYTGSSDYKAIPLASFSVDTRIGIVSSEQIGIKIDFIKSRGLDTGPIFKYQFGRDNSMSDAVVASLPEVAGSLEVGWFLGSGIPLSVLGLNSEAILTGKIAAHTDIGDGHGGSTFSASTALVFPVSPELRVITSLAFNFSDENYQQSFFGVSEADALTSGLPAFKATGGLESTGLSLIIVKQLNKRWSATSITSLSTLQADAEKSPLTKRGSALQLFMAIVLTYNFN